MDNLRHRRGDLRADGKQFWAYTKTGTWWVSPKKFLLLQRNKNLRSQLSRGPRQQQKTPKSPEDLRAYDRARRASQLEKFRARERKNQRKHRDKRAAANKEWRLKNKAACDRNRKDWQKKNPGKVAAVQAFRRAKKLISNLRLRPDQKQTVATIFAARRRVSLCSRIPFHVDHIIPLSRGGPHAPSNLQLLPKRINLKKNAKLPHELL